MARGPRKATLTRNILQTGLDSGYLTKDLALALHELKKAYFEGRAVVNPSNNEDAISTREILMRGLDNGVQLARQWEDDWRGVGEDTEPGFRARLSDEIATAMRRGGLELKDGSVKNDVVGTVFDTVLELNPGISNEVRAEINAGSGPEMGY